MNRMTCMLAGLLTGLFALGSAEANDDALSEGISTPLVTSTWSGVVPGEFSTAHNALTINLSNISSETVSVEVAYQFSGMGMVIDVPVRELKMKPGAQATASLPVSKLGLISDRLSTGVRAVIEVSVGNGQVIHYLSGPLFFHADPNYSSIVVYSERVMVEEFGGGVLGDPFDIHGFIRDGGGIETEILEIDGEMVDWDEAELGGGLVVGGSRVVESAGSEEPWEEEWFEGEKDTNELDWVIYYLVKFCTKWRWFFEDVGVGEDYWNANPYPYGTAAAYTKANIFEGGAHPAMIWSGYLDSSGCTPTLSVLAGGYLVNQFSSVYYSRGGTGYTFNIRNASNQEKSIQTATSVSGSGTIYLSPSTNTDWINATALAGQLLKTADHGLATGTLRIIYDDDCPTVPGSACYDPPTRTVYMPTVTQKFRLTHEIGHDCQYATVGSFALNYSQDATQWQCRCDHVVSSSQLHCLQSREKDDAAICDGFGYFYAAKPWNDTAQANCWMGYQKEFLKPHNTDWNNQAAATLYYPPVPRNCYARPAYKNSSYQPWMEAYCLASNAGVEHDWMNFFWVWHTTTANKASMTEIYDVINRACYGQPGDPPPKQCSNSDIGWEALRQGAEWKWTIGTPQYVHFNDTAGTYGVRH